VLHNGGPRDILYFFLYLIKNKKGICFKKGKKKMLSKQKKVDPEFPKDGYNLGYFQEVCEGDIKIVETVRNQLYKSEMIFLLVIPITVIGIYILLVSVYAIIISVISTFFILDKGFVWNTWIMGDFITSFSFVGILICVIACLFCSMCSIVFGRLSEKEGSTTTNILYWIGSILAYVMLFINIIYHFIFAIYYTTQSAKGVSNNSTIPYETWSTLTWSNWGYIGLSSIPTCCVCCLAFPLVIQLRKIKSTKVSINANDFSNVDVQRTIVNICTRAFGYNPFNQDKDNELRYSKENTISIKNNVPLIDNIYVKNTP
jgi:hypothetical protein